MVIAADALDAWDDPDEEALVIERALRPLGDHPPIWAEIEQSKPRNAHYGRARQALMSIAIVVADDQVICQFDRRRVSAPSLTTEPTS